MSKWSMRTPDRPNRIDLLRSDVINALNLKRISYEENLAINEVITDMISGNGPIRELPHRAMQSQAWGAVVHQIVDEIHNRLGLGLVLNADDPEILDMWPDTLPWGEDEQNYYRTSAIPKYKNNEKIFVPEYNEPGVILKSQQWSDGTWAYYVETYEPIGKDGFGAVQIWMNEQEIDAGMKQMDEPGDMTIPWDDAEQEYYRRSKQAGAGGIEWPPCLACGKIAGFDVYPFAAGTLQCNHCHSLEPVRQVADRFNALLKQHSDQLDEYGHPDEPGDLTLPESWGKSGWFRKKPAPEPVRAPDPAVRPSGQPYTYNAPDEKPILYPQIPEQGLPFFIAPDGEIFHDGPGSSHLRLIHKQLRPRGLDKSLTQEYDKWSHGRLFPEGLVDYNRDLTPEQQEKLLEVFEPYLRTSKVATGYPANYTDDDPLDLQGKQPLFESMSSQWWMLPPDEGKRAVVNAFRATMLSPRQNLRSNAVLYQLLMNVDPNESNPDVFEQIVRDMKQQWDAQGQTDMFSDPEEQEDPNQFLPGRLQPGIWTNIRRLAALGPYADQIYQAAMDDIEQGGTGELFRDRILKLGIPGVGAKVSSFAWLALAPTSSELGTIDVHMMRHLDQDRESPKNQKEYFELEQRLRQERDELYPGVPLTQYQWGVWDKRRTPGFHQDHTPLRPVDPTPYTDVQWERPKRQPRPQRLPEQDPNQLGFQFGKWTHDGLVTARAPQGGYRVSPPDASDQFDKFVKDVVGLMSFQQQPSSEEYLAIYDSLRRLTKGVVPEKYTTSWGKGLRITKEYTQLAWEMADKLEQLPVIQQYKIPNTDLRPQWQLEYDQEHFNGVPELEPPPSMWSKVLGRRWEMYRLGGFSLQGEIVTLPNARPATGVAVMPERQSKEEILRMLDQFSTHQDDTQKQRQMIPDYAINRGGKVADFRMNPDQTGFSYAPGAIIVSQKVDVDDNWILYHDSCQGIVAGIGGAASHGVYVARERNIPIVVNLNGWDQINPGDMLTIDPSTGRVDINGGNTEEFGEATPALEPVTAWVWSRGEGTSLPIPPGSAGAATLHRQMIRQRKQQGTWDKIDSVMGVLYEDGHVQSLGEASDNQEMQQWLNSIRATTTTV
jgi:phosphohistidine swiveling domain-containing protein